jgi:hypothetical protein
VLSIDCECHRRAPWRPESRTIAECLGEQFLFCLDRPGGVFPTYKHGKLHSGLRK